MVANGNPGQDGCARSQPYPATYADGGVGKILPARGGKMVIECGEDNAVADQAVIPDVDAALILELAARVDEYAFPDVNVATEIGVERRKQGERIVRLLFREAGKKALNLLRRVVGVVQFAQDAPCGITLRSHEGNHLFSLQRFSRCYLSAKYLKRHHRLSQGAAQLPRLYHETRFVVNPFQGAVRANALGNAFAYVRFTRYDVRFINNVRVAQISRIINVC